MKKKIFSILLPFALLSISTVILYTFLNWLLIIKLQLFNPKEEIIHFWVPIILASIVCFIFLRPKLKILVKRKKGDLNTGFLTFAVITMATSMIIAQKFLETATGKLTTLTSIHDIISKPLTKFYTLNNHFIDKDDAAIYYTSSVSGRNNENLNFDIYLACPI